MGVETYEKEPSQVQESHNDILSTASNSNAPQNELFETGLSDEEVAKNVTELIGYNPSLESYTGLLHKGAILANDGGKVFEHHAALYTAEEIHALNYELHHSIKSQGRAMFLIAIVASFAAVNFGMDESAVGGAQLQYIKEFNITNSNVQGTVNAAPYLAAGTIGTLSTTILDRFLGRKWIIFISCIFGIAGSLWQAFSHSMGSLLAARLFLGIGMGINSSCAPMFVAETSPAKSRGVFLMLWQTFVAFGVMLGSVFNRAFVDVSGSASWRLMIGSSFVPPIVVAALILFAPESPRYLLANDQPRESLEALIKLRPTELAAARDFFVLYNSLLHAGEINKVPLFQQVKLFFTDKRIRFAFLVSSFVIFMQQYCGVNILVGYTTTILVSSGVDDRTAIAGSIGIGGGCFLATFFSSLCIDRVGRRRMLLYTFPVLAICLFWLGGSLHINNADSRLGSGLTSMYLFVIGFGLGIGPISWTMNAEVYPLHVRALGVTLGMTINWVLDFVLSMSWPKMAASLMHASGGLFFYGAWNLYAFGFTYFFVPETMRLTLEEIDVVFSQGAAHHFVKKTKRLLGLRG